MNILINVPYKEKDAAKAKGARWDPNIKSWYISDPSRIPGCLQWLPKHNIICENLYLLKMKQECWNCHTSTDIVLLATDKSYSKENNYLLNSDIQILTYTTEMPAPLAGYMRNTWKYFPAFSRAINGRYFANHCIGCSQIQGDNFLHEIPEKAFYKRLFYQNANPINYAMIRNQFGVPIEAELPQYDAVHSSVDLLKAHMEMGIENRASIGVTQAKINHLFDANISIQDADIVIPGL